MELPFLQGALDSIFDTCTALFWSSFKQIGGRKQDVYLIIEVQDGELSNLYLSSQNKPVGTGRYQM